MGVLALQSTGLDPDQVMGALALLAGLGIGLQWVAWRLQLPSILLLLLGGILVGPVLDLFDPRLLLGDLLHPLVSLAVAVILFEGGLSLDLRELRGHGGVVLRLVTVGVLVTWLVASLAAVHVLDMPPGVALVLGAILSVTGPTVVGPLLRQIRPRGAVEAVARWEGIFVDIVGATLAVLVLHEVIAFRTGSGGTIPLAVGAALELLRVVVVGGSLGALGAAFIAYPFHRHWIPDELENPVALSIVLVVYAAADALAHESGLLAVTLMGFLLANQRTTSMHHVLEFKENLRVLLLSTLFVVLAATLDLDELRATGWSGLAFVGILVVVARPLAVLLSTVGSRLSRRERIFLGFLAPRGIVAAAVSALFGLRLAEAGVPGADQVAPLAFLVIVCTVALYGFGAGAIAHRLELSDPQAQGTVVAGAGPFARALGETLQREGIPVLLVDTNRDAVARARLAGLHARSGSILSAELRESLPLGGTGRLLALTANDEVNALACMQFARLYGRAGVFQLVSTDAGASESDLGHLRGRPLFAPEATYPFLDELVRHGAEVKATRLSERFDLDAHRDRYAGRVLPLGRVDQEERLTLYTPDGGPEIEAGEKLVALVLSEEGARALLDDDEEGDDPQAGTEEQGEADADDGAA